MKFTLIKDLRQDRMMRPILSGLLFFTILYLLTDILVKYNSIGISPDSVKSTFFGNEEEFLEAMSQASFLEFWHTDIFFIMMVVFTLSVIYIRLTKASKTAIIFVNIMMVSAILSLISIALSYFFSSNFINIYLGTFFIWHLVALFSSFHSLKRLYSA